MNNDTTLSRLSYAGLFGLSLASLMYEVLLTRIFSVTLWYHFAFMAVSVAMFGMTVGAVVVYLFPNFFTLQRAKRHLALSTLLFALTSLASFILYLYIPLPQDTASIQGALVLGFIYALIAIPFTFSGVSICTALAKFPRQVSKLYAADLVGAAIGCLLLLLALNVTDGPTVMIVIALIASVAALLFTLDANQTRLVPVVAACCVLLGAFAVVHALLANNQSALLKLIYVKGQVESPSGYEKWNSYSRIRVAGDPALSQSPFGWGLSPLLPNTVKSNYMLMRIDGAAGTPLTRFAGDLNTVDYLKLDIVNLAHYARQNAGVLVVGTGGERDILSALVFKQKSVTGVELNPDILNTVNGTFGDYTGHLDRYPNVTFIADEARSYISRSSNQYDIIQLSLIDTWAATSAGAFVLSENSLYTTEAWQTFLHHLTPGGIFTVSRWYYRDRPGEMYRLTALAVESLKRMGIQHPREHILIARRMWDVNNSPDGVGTLLVSNQPFSQADIQLLTQTIRRLQFDLVLTPSYSLDPTFEALASAPDLERVVANSPINISAPTDDNPYFFNMLRLTDFLNQTLLDQGVMTFNMVAIRALGVLIVVVAILTLACIILPILLKSRALPPKSVAPLLIYFGCIGLGFMLIEIAQMQRLTVFLGPPAYGLAVVLFTLLLSGGLGSRFTDRVSIEGKGYRHIPVYLLMLLLGVLLVCGYLTPVVIRTLNTANTEIRILVAVLLTFPMGLWMGMAFPIGMKLAALKSPNQTPWLWGINGAASVVASVLAVAISMSWSITTSFLVGMSCYAIALFSFLHSSRRAAHHGSYPRTG